MSVQRWDVEVTCPKEACEGVVRVRGYYDPGRTYGDPYYCYPPEGEEEFGECDVCGCDEWTEEEEKVLSDRAARSSGD